MHLDEISKANNYFSTRARIGVVIILLLLVGFFVLLLDVLVWRPRESATKFDKDLLMKELQLIAVETTSYGSWQNEFVFLKPSGLVVSKDFAPRQGKENGMILLTEALQNRGWKPYLPTSKSALVTLCKGKYRVSLEWHDATQKMGASFTVKEFKNESDC